MKRGTPVLNILIITVIVAGFVYLFVPRVHRATNSIDETSPSARSEDNSRLNALWSRFVDWKESLTYKPREITPVNWTQTGAVTFRFDDGIETHYFVAAPTLEAAGFRGTFYIISRQILDNEYSGFVSIAEVRDLYNRGHEIGV